MRRCEALPNCNISDLAEVSGDGANYDEELEAAVNSNSNSEDTTTILTGQASRNETKPKVDMGRNETSETTS